MKTDNDELKWNLVKVVSKAGNRFGNLLDEMLRESDVSNTQQLTSEQALKYCERHGIGCKPLDQVAMKG